MSGGVGRQPGDDRFAAVVVNYESGSALERCIGDLLGEVPAETVIVDNGSSDGSVDRARLLFGEVGVIATGYNLGYGAAVNRGLAATSAPFVLVCNPDLEMEPGATARLSKALTDHPDWAVAGPRVLDEDGHRYPSARRFPSFGDAVGHAVLGMFVPDNRFTRAYRQTQLDDVSIGETTVDWVSGACFLARREALEQVGGFDETYFMYVEDVDLCWRLRRQGWEVGYVPSSEVTHLQGVSTDRHPYRMIVEHHRSLLRFAARSSSGWRAALLPLIAVGIGLRVGVACAVRYTSS